MHLIWGTEKQFMMAGVIGILNQTQFHPMKRIRESK
jgi:hypothetical protein